MVEKRDQSFETTKGKTELEDSNRLARCEEKGKGPPVLA